MGAVDLGLGLLGFGLLVFWNQQRDPNVKMRAYRFWKPWPELPTNLPPYVLSTMHSRLIGFAVGQVLVFAGLVVLAVVALTCGR